MTSKKLFGCQPAILLKKHSQNKNMLNNNGPEYRHLDAFVGKWNTTGYMKSSPSGPSAVITGTDTYEWLPGGFFLLHKVNVLMGDERNETFEIIGFDKQSNSYPMHFYDNKGNTGIMQASFVNGTWIFLGESMRFTGRFSENNNILSGIWEQSIDGSDWIHLMNIKLSKVS